MATKQKKQNRRKARPKTKLATEALAPTRAAAAEPPVLTQSDATKPRPAAELSLSSISAVETISGLYLERAPGRGELRLDLDGPNPQMTASGLVVSGLADRLHWVAKLDPPASPDQWTGSIWFKDGASALLPHTSIQITLERTGHQRDATVRFADGALPTVTRMYRRRSAYFHPVEFEFDVVQGTTATTEIDTCAHPNRPADLPCERLTIETVFRRAGFEVSVSPGSGSVPLSVAGGNQIWSNTEMHDAMQTYWSRFENEAQWSLWVLFAARHDDGPSLGGIMFDDIGPNHRQGTAMFNDSFIADAPVGDAEPAAWVARMRFWTACHEMGHAFNLAHSWQEALGTPWIPLSNEPEARTFMNYPYNVSGGQTSFFSDFAFRFSDQELLFMRHAPERFVQMGNADWFDHHGFEQAEAIPEPKYRLELRANRAAPIFEFLEPCVLEVKLTNLSGEPQLISEQVLQDADRMVVILKKDGAPARRWLPYAQYCHKARRIVLEPGASRYEGLFVGAGRNGWDLAEPGIYTAQIVLRIAGEDFVSNRLRIRVTPPRNYEEEYLAQDFFSEDVGRVLAFNGSRVMNQANNVLRETANRLAGRAVACHALIALNRPMLRDGKVLDIPGRALAEMAPASDLGGGIKLVKAQFTDAEKGMKVALTAQPEKAAETLGHIDYKAYADRLSDQLAAHGNTAAAAKVQDQIYATLQARNVMPGVLTDVKEKRDSFKAAKKRGRMTA
jgi:hypothetical protein